MSYTQNQITHANETDLVAFLSAQGEELIKIKQRIQMEIACQSEFL